MALMWCWWTGIDVVGEGAGVTSWLRLKLQEGMLLSAKVGGASGMNARGHLFHLCMWAKVSG